MKNQYINAFLAVVIILTSGCAKEPTLGDKIFSQGVSTEELGDKWNKGNKLVIKGKKMRKKGQELVEEGEERIEKGGNMIRRGKGMMEKSEKTFRERFPPKPQ